MKEEKHVEEEKRKKKKAGGRGGVGGRIEAAPKLCRREKSKAK